MKDVFLRTGSTCCLRNFSNFLLKRSRFIFVVLFCIFSTVLFAQQPVSGKVTSGDSAFVGATIQVKGSNIATQTDASGNFTINAAPNATLVISSIGYTPQEVKVANKTSLNIVLASAASNLNEVVVIGYGTVRRRDLTGAVATIKGGDIKAQGVSDITRSLQGRMPGVTIESAGGDPGSGTRILIRGVGTLGNAAPLYIVDGVQVSNINNLASNDIESIDVLKDASAAAIYGSRAANGVVLVTTKSGRSGKPVIQFSTNIGAQKIGRQVEVLNAREWATVSNAAHIAAGFSPLDGFREE